MKELKKLTVKYNGKIVGYLAEIGEQVGFQYDDEWRKHGFSISPFSLPLSDKIYRDGKLIFDGLYGVFFDSLPDGWGMLLVRRMLAKKGINFDTLSTLQKLSIIQKNGLGALEYEPSEAFKLDAGDLDLDKLSTEANKILNDNYYKSYDLDNVYYLGGSSGGSRPKAHIEYNNEEWIVKFPCRFDPEGIGKKEFEANTLAKKCGINVNEFKLFDSKLCSGYFGAKRFDRSKDRKIHMISLAGILETSHTYLNLDYGHLFRVIKQISVHKDDMYEAFRMMCFNVFYHNTDDHSKNIAFLYDEKLNGYVLSPAYDITTTPEKVEHTMTINGKGNPTEEDLFAIANQFHLSSKKCKGIVLKIKSVLNIK